MKREVDVIFIACMTSVVLITIATALGLVSGNNGWYNLAVGPWIIFICSLIAGAVRTLRKRE